MLLVLTGASCSGKSTLARGVAHDLTGVAVHDFDEIGVPADADRWWRHRGNEHWVQRALDYQEHGVHLLLTGQSPLGEILATPSAPLLDGIAVCLVDVADAVRGQRLEQRDPGRWSPAAVRHLLGWARWHRGHAADPRHRRRVLTAGAWEAMAWYRWWRWRRGDPRWQTGVLDTTSRTVAEAAAYLRAWLTVQQRLHQAGRLPLRLGWDDPQRRAR